MTKEYTLIHPDIDPGRGRTRQLLDELISSWREGKNEGAAEIAAVVDLLSDTENLPAIYRLQKGGLAERLSREFASFLVEMKGSPPILKRVARDRGWKEVPLYVSCVGQATGALYAALAANKVSGGEVITTSLNYVGVVNAIILAGATPRFVDVDERTWCMDPDDVAKAITKKTRAIILTHLNQFVDLEPFYEILRGKGDDITLIQDASLAIGSTLNGMRPGLLNLGSGVTVMSLTVSKPISGLGGAIITSHDFSLLERIITIAYQGIGIAGGGDCKSFGANLKLSGLNAAIALERLKRREEIFARRRQLRVLYNEGLLPLVEKGAVTLQDVGDEAVFAHYGVLVPDRESLAKALYERHRIQLGLWHVHHLQPIYREKFEASKRKLPRSEGLAGKLTFLPFHTRLSDEDVSFICDVLVKELS